MEKVIAIDYGRCTGCRRCELACSLHHFGECNPKLSCIRLVFLDETKETFPVSCANCSTPICMDLCPVKAIKIDPKTTAAVIDSNRCIGCKTCVIHCPFGAAGFNPQTQGPLQVRSLWRRTLLYDILSIWCVKVSPVR